MQRLFRLVTGIFLSLTLLLMPASQANAASRETKYIKGESRQVGKGEVFTWIRVDKKTGIPTQLGISVTTKAMQGLPEDDGQAQGACIRKWAPFDDGDLGNEKMRNVACRGVQLWPWARCEGG